MPGELPNSPGDGSASWLDFFDWIGNQSGPYRVPDNHPLYGVNYDDDGLFSTQNYPNLGGTGTTGGTGGGDGMSDTGFLDRANDFLSGANDFFSSPTGRLIAGGLQGYLSQGGINDAVRAQAGGTQNALNFLSASMNNYLRSASPFYNTGKGAADSLNSYVANPYQFEYPDFSKEIGLRNTLLDNMNAYATGQAGNQLPDPMMGNYRDMTEINNRYMGGDFNFSPRFNPMSAFQSGELVDPTNYESEPYQVMMDEGIRAIENSQGARGKLNSGDTLARLQELGTGLKQNQIQTAMGLRGQQFGEQATMSDFMQRQLGQDFSFGVGERQQRQSEIGQNFGQSLASRRYDLDENRSVWDRLSGYRSQLFGEDLDKVDSAMRMSNQVTQQPIDIARTMFNIGAGNRDINFRELYNLASMGANVTSRVGNDALSFAGSGAGYLDEFGNVKAASEITSTNQQNALLGDLLQSFGFNDLVEGGPDGTGSGGTGGNMDWLQTLAPLVGQWLSGNPDASVIPPQQDSLGGNNTNTDNTNTGNSQYTGPSIDAIVAGFQSGNIDEKTGTQYVGSYQRANNLSMEQVAERLGLSEADVLRLYNTHGVNI